MLAPSLFLALSLMAPMAGPEAAASAGPLDLTRRIVRGADEPGQAVAGYVRIRNGSPVADDLVSVTCDCARSVEFHQIRRDGPNPGMITDARWTAPGNGTLDIRPGSDLHLMLIDYDPARARNGQVRLILTFAEAGPVEADFALVPDSRMAWEAFD